jgi:hypothetical protein
MPENGTHNVDAYATSVVYALARKGMSLEKAKRLINEQESFIRRAYHAGIKPEFISDRLSKGARRVAAKVKSFPPFKLVPPKKRHSYGYAFGTQGCQPFVPPVFTTPEIARALERNSKQEDDRGHIFGKAGRVPKKGPGMKPGVYHSNKEGTSWMKGGAKYVSSSDNGKIGAVDTTWVSIQSTCVDCDFKTAEVCYAMGGNAQYTVYIMDKAAAAEGDDATATAQNEADCIDSAYDGGEIPEGRILRIHSSGDTSTVEGAKAIGAAVVRWYKRGGHIAYTYTHAWRRVPRAAFGPLSVLASLNPNDDARDALKQGYGSVTALVTNDVWASRMVITKTGQIAFKILDLGEKGAGLKFVPCPAQYPVDKEHSREAFTWKLMFLGRAIGVPEDQLEKFASKLKSKIKLQSFDAQGLPPTEPFMPFADAIAKTGKFPPVQSQEFRQIFRLVGDGEKATCDKCGLCYDDKALGAPHRDPNGKPTPGRAVAFRGDKSGGIVETESLLRKKQVEQLINLTTK